MGFFSKKKEIKENNEDESILKEELQTEVETLALKNYNRLLESGVAPEQARMILPQSMMTEWYWSGTLMAFARVCNLRCKPDTQLETQMVANQIDEVGEEYFPVSWKALRDG